MKIYEKLNLLKQLFQSGNNENFFFVTSDRNKADIIEAMAELENKQVIRWNADKDDNYFNVMNGTEEELIRIFDNMDFNDDEKLILTMAVKTLKRINIPNLSLMNLFEILQNNNENIYKYIDKLDYDEENYIIMKWFLEEYYTEICRNERNPLFDKGQNIRFKLMQIVFNPALSKMINVSPTEQEISVTQTTKNLVQIVVLPDDIICMEKYFQFIRKVIDIQFEMTGETIPFTYYVTDDKLETYPKNIDSGYMELILDKQKELREKAEKAQANTDINEIIGEKIRRKREALGFSREEMAEIFDITPNFLGDVERGKKALSTQKMLFACNVLNISLDGIITNTDAEDIKNKIKEMSNSKNNPS